MNPLSLAAVVSACFLAAILYQRATYSRMDRQNGCSLLVLGLLAWWCLCDAFFYVAPDQESAWRWHRLGAPGWCGFIAATAYYFLVMTGVDRAMPVWKKFAFWLPALALTVRFTVGQPSAMAVDLVLSRSGLGWTYVQRYDTVWPFLFLAYLLIYMGGALGYLLFWQRKLPCRSEKWLAKGFVWLDCAAVGMGFLSIFVLPYLSDYLPPAGCLAALTFGLGYWSMLRKIDFHYVELALNPGNVLENCLGPLVVTDARYTILYANSAAQKLIGPFCEGGRLTQGFTQDSQGLLDAALASGGDQASMELTLENGVPLLASLSRMAARMRRMEVCVLYFQEIAQMKEVTLRLNDLAHHDELTGLCNRRGLNAALPHWIERYHADGTDFELLFLDLYRFKAFNDTFGHAAGDEVLKAVARALEAVVAPGDLTARFAGDEFVILHSGENAHDLTSAIHEAFHAIDCTAFAPGFRIEADIGVCMYSEAGSVSALFRIADGRMYADKEGRGQSAYFA